MKLAPHDTGPRVGVVEQVSDACHDVNTALSTIALCIDFLAEQSQTVGHEAVQDARIAVRRVSVVMATLRDTLEPEESAAKTSAVFRRSDPPGPDNGRSRPQTT
jgi:hypothetical protein